jgi:glutamine amidotransferase
MGFVTVINYGMGNTGSVMNMLRKIGVSAKLASDPGDLLDATRIVLPGVGAFDNAMIKLRESGYIEVLNQKVITEKVPILGICLGMQLFSKNSEEGMKPGLGWLDAETIRFKSEPGSKQIKIPHMGWNTVQISQNTCLFPLNDQDIRFYFVHSLYIKCNNPNDVLTQTDYGGTFTSAVCRQNILGTQFHPEKSHRFGMNFFKAFSNWVPTTSPTTLEPKPV